MTALELKIYEIVRHVPAGKVATYGQIALLLGNGKLARVVGNTMHKNPVPFWQLARQAGFCNFAPNEDDLAGFEPVPCHRIVDSQGRMGKHFGMGGPEIQAEMLKAEGVAVCNGKVTALEQFCWQPE